MSILPARPARVAEPSRLPKTAAACCVSAAQIRRYGARPATAASRFMNETTRARFRFLVVVSRRRRVPDPRVMRRRRFAAQRQNLCTTEALRHGETQRIDELFWPPGTLGPFQGAVSLFQTSSHQQKAEDTESGRQFRRSLNGGLDFPWPRFSDAGTSSKYR